MYNNNIIQWDLSLITSQNINFWLLKNKSILITGATGMLASYYMYTLMLLNDKYNYNIKIYPLIRDKNKLDNLVDLDSRNDLFPIEQDVCLDINLEGKIDYIIHMASSSNPSTITTNPVGIIKANVLGTLNILNLAKKNDAKVVFTSTREVYGKVENRDTISENDMWCLDCAELRSCYPESKRLAENLIISYSYQYWINYQIARIAHSYWPGMIIKNDGRIMSDLINNVVEHNNIILKSNGEAKRSFCYIADAISALFMITFNEEYNQIYNLSNETEEISIRDLAYSLKEWYKDRNIDVIFDIQDNKNKYVKFKRVQLNNSRLENLWWKPLVSLKDGISRTIRFFDAQK